MAYSVSPRLTFSSFGPNPSENVEHADAVPARHHEVPELVHEDEDAEDECKRQKGGH